MNDREFHLCREPWILVMQKDFRMKEVSLEEALICADEYRGLAGETETQNMAILRLLLACLHTVFSREDEMGNKFEIDSKTEADRRWKAIWDMGHFPQMPIRSYFKQWEERFWLFDKQYPFYQVPALEGTYNPVKKMNGELVESNNKIQLFSLTSGKEKEQMAYDEAARWLIHLQNFEDTAAKKPSPKRCWTGSLGLVAAKGNTLFETLMLNLTLLKDGQELWGEAKPSWERDKPETDKLKEIPIPDNQPELLTMQCRRLLLQREEGVVKGYVEAAGDYFDGESAFSEQMTFWAKREKKGMTEMVPYVHDATRQMWRDFSVLVGETGKKPGVVAWIKHLQAKGKLEKSKFVSFQIVGVVYGSMNCGIADTFSDSLQIHISLLEDLEKIWQSEVKYQVEYSAHLANAVGQLASSLDKARGGDGGVAREQAKEQAYYRLDMPFRQWLLQVEPKQTQEDRKENVRKWRETARRLILNLGNELVRQAGVEAVIGRSRNEKVKNKLTELNYSEPEAFNYFLFSLKNIERAGK